MEPNHAANLSLLTWSLAISLTWIGLMPLHPSAGRRHVQTLALVHSGLIDYNSADAAVVVPKRLGWGWTFNFARPASWLYLAAVLAFCTFVTLITKLLR